MTLKLFALFALTSSLAACADAGDARQQGAKRIIVDSSGGTVALGIGSSRNYRSTAMSGGGAVDGTVTVQGTPKDSLVAVGKDAKVCGDSARLSDKASVANTLVWIEGIGSGKPLPEVRRQTLSIEKCSFEPRVMAVVTHSTINVFSRDRVSHGPRFYREAAPEPLVSIHTVDAGQVVPSEKIAAQPGIVEVRCEEHPFARAYIAVFDHPYFAVTDDKGSFKIDGLPPGTYTAKLWHEGLAKPIEQRVVVTAGGASRLDLALNIGGSTASNAAAPSPSGSGATR